MAPDSSAWSAIGEPPSRSRPALVGREAAAIVLLLIGVCALVGVVQTPLVTALPLLVVLMCVWAVAVFHYIFAVPHYALVAVLALAILQDILIGLFGGRDPSRTGVLLLVAFTTALPAFFAGWFGLVRSRAGIDRRIFPLHVVGILYVALVLASAAYGGRSGQAMLPALRNALAFLVMFYFAYLLPGLTPRVLRRVMKAFGFLVFLTVLFGYLERFVLGDQFWVDVLNLDVIARIKNLPPTQHVDVAVPADFYSPVAGVYYRRMASFFATPIPLGYFLAFTFVYVSCTAAAHRRGRRVVRLVAGVALALTLLVTLVKGAYGIAGLGMMAVGATVIGVRLRWSFGRIVATWVVLAIPVAFIAFRFAAGSTALLHWWGLAYTFRGLSGARMILLGNGLGSGGRISQRLGAAVPISESTGAESGIGTLLYQFGIVGVVLYLAFFLLTLRRLFHVYADHRIDRRFRLAGLGVLGACFGLLGAVFLQESALAPIPIAPYFIFAGALLNVVGRANGSEGGRLLTTSARSGGGESAA